MARISDITSTEKLLNIIRSRREEATAPAAEEEPVAGKKGRFDFSLPKVISLKKTSTVGIDVGHNCLRMVKAAKTSGGRWQVEDRRSLALPLRTPRDSVEFRSFLRAAISSLTGPAKQAELWAIMSAAHVEVRHIRIPKVPKKQISNAVYWTAKKEGHFDEKEMAFDYELQGEVIEQGIAKYAVMVYTAPHKEIEELKDLFARIGHPLTGISIVPFSLQNLFRTGRIPSLEGAVASLFIGNDFSRIDVYAGNNLVMTRGIKAGFSSMVEALVDSVNERERGLAAGALLTNEQGRKIIWSLSPDASPLGEDDAGCELAKEEIFAMIQPALERLVRQVERTFEHFLTTSAGERISRMYVSGAMNVSPPFLDYIKSQLGVACEILDPLREIDPAAVREDGDANSVAERIAFGPALGLAFSGNDHTPNLMFTYKEKETAASIFRINIAVFAVFIAAVVLCSGIFIFQNIAVAQKKKTIEGLAARMAALGPAIDRGELTRLAAKVRAQRQLSRGYAARYLGVVLISELIELTPANVNFTDLKINLGALPAGPGGAGGGTAEKAAGGAPAGQPGSAAAGSPPASVAGAPAAGGVKASPEEICVEGLILGNRQQLEISLAHYVMALEASPLFRQVTIQKNLLEPFAKSEALHFILKIGVEVQLNV